MGDVKPPAWDVARWLWAWRDEWVLAAVGVGVRGLLGGLVGPAFTGWIVLAAGACCVWVNPLRGIVEDHLLAARRRRRWERALRVCEPAVPRIRTLSRDRCGEQALVRIAAGATVADLAKRAEALAAMFAVEEVRVRRHQHNAALAQIQALAHDPLTTMVTPWPWQDAARVSLWEPIPVGVGEDGHETTLELFEHNLLVGGEPGAGKSVAVSQLVAAAALDPTAALWLLDGKLVELACWKPCAAAFAGVDIDEAIDVLRVVRSHMDARYEQLLDTGSRKISCRSGLHVVVVDELAHYVTWPERKPRDTFTDVLRDLVSRGRAAGVIVIAATQKPSSDVIPTSLRDLFGYRWALRCTTPAASDTILGAGWASQSVSAATIRPVLRGVGWLLHESGEPVRLRAHHLDDRTIDAIASRSRQLRQEAQP